MMHYATSVSLYKVAFILTVALCVLSQDYGYGYGASGEVFEDYGNYGPVTTSLHAFRDIIDKWFGSSTKANDKLWNRMRSRPQYFDQTCYLDMAWLYEEAGINLRTEENIPTYEEEMSVINAIQSAILTELEYANNLTNSDGQNCTEFFLTLRKYRSNLDCAIEPSAVTKYFIAISPPTNCWEFSEDLWRAVISANLDECSDVEVYNDLVHVAQIATGRSTDPSWSTDIEELNIDLMAKLTETLSSPKHMQYLNRIICPFQPTTIDCQAVIDEISQTLCGPLSIPLVKNIEALVKKGSAANPIDQHHDISIMLEIMSDLVDVVEVVSKIEERSVSTDFAMGMLETYLDIVDITIGNSSAPVWKQMGRGQASQNLQTVLVNNEKYVSAVSNMIFTDQRDFHPKKIEQLSLTLQLKKSRSSSNENVGFEFNEAEIETAFLGDNSEDSLSVYAIHYKSWAELQSVGELKSDNRSDSRKYFVGDGGIVSLSAHMNQEKKSIPVSYKMKFGSKTNVGKTTKYEHRCLSCEYLNTTTGEWESHGCFIKGVNDYGVTCHCSHTTNFAAFMSPIEIELNMTDAQYNAKQIVSYVGSAASVIALAVSLLIFNMVRQTVRNDRLKAHINLAVALFFVHATQLTVDFATHNDVACVTTTIITHFFLLASFFWMLIEGIFLYLYVVQVFVHSSVEYIRWLFVMGWAIPALIVAVSAGFGIPNNLYIDMKETYCEEGQILYPSIPGESGSSYERCWLSVKSGMVWSFIGPALFIIAFNCVILAKVVQVLVKVSGRQQSMKPFRPPAGALSSKRNYENSSFVNKMCSSKEPKTQARFMTSGVDNTKPKRTEEEKNSNYGSTSNGKAESAAEKYKAAELDCRHSPSRFDARIPSQAYMYNRAPYRTQQSTQLGPSEDSNFVNDVKAAVKGALVLLPILGIPWICGMLVGSSYVFIMLFLVMNSTQGVMIFVVYCIMNGEVRRAMQRRLRLVKMHSKSGRSRASSTSSLRSLNSKFGINWRRKQSTTVSQLSNK